MAIENCVSCSKKLTGLRTRFCGDVCYGNHKTSRAKAQAEMMRRKNPSRNCTICGEEFFPLRQDNTACSKGCSQIQAKDRQKEKRAELRKFEPVKPLKVRNPLVPVDQTKLKRVKTAEFRVGDTTKNQVLQYLRSGGTILKFPDEPRAKTPDVNVQFGHTMDELMGFGLEYDADELQVPDAL